MVCIPWSGLMSAVRSKSFILAGDSVKRQSGLLRILEDLEGYAQSLKDNGVALANVRETRASLQRLVDKLDGLETGFDRIAERSRTSIMSFPFVS